MKKEIYIYLLLFAAIGCSVYLETVKLLKSAEINQNIETVNLLDAKSSELTELIARKKANAEDTTLTLSKDELLLGFMLRVKDSALVMNLSSHWFDARQFNIKMPFQIADDFHYKFVICSNFKNCSSFHIPEFTFVKLLTDRFMALQSDQKS